MPVRSAEDMKAEIAKRVEMRKGDEDLMPNVIEEIDELDAEDGGLAMDDAETQEFMEDALAQAEVAEIIDALHEQGFNAFMDGVPEEDCPCEDEAETEVWLEGWQGAYTHACLSELLLGVKDLVEAASPEEAESAMNVITEVFPFVEGVVDLEESQMFLDELAEDSDEPQQG